MATVFKILPYNGEDYGFPIEIPESQIDNVNNFIVENGYSQDFLDISGPVFCYSIWEEEVVEQKSSGKK
jgi:hypothetical protein